MPDALLQLRIIMVSAYQRALGVTFYNLKALIAARLGIGYNMLILKEL